MTPFLGGFMKIAVIAKSFENISNCDALIIGLKDFSCNMYEESFDFISNLVNNSNKEIFVGINKNIHNNEIEILKEYLIKFSKINIKGILYADVAILKINNDLNLNLNLIWSQEHLVTNYNTIDFWLLNGAKGAFLSNEITLREINEIRENIKSPLMLQVFGYIPIYVSRRHAVKNYLDNFNINKDKSFNYLFKEDKKYPILDKNNGTELYSNNILCTLDEYKSYQKFDYIVLSFFNIDGDYSKIIDYFKTVNDKNVKEYMDNLNQEYSNLDKIFWFRETIYKVK